MNTWNIHRESENTRNWFRYETFIYLFEFKVFRHEERDTQFLSMLSFPSDPHHVWPPLQTTGLASARYENRLALSKPKSQLSRSEFKSQLTVFFLFQNPQRFRAWHHSRPRSYFYLGFLSWHLWLTHPPRTRVKTCTQCVHLTNPCSKP